MSFVVTHPYRSFRIFQIVANYQLPVCFKNAKQPYMALLTNSSQLHPSKFYFAIMDTLYCMPRNQKIHQLL